MGSTGMWSPATLVAQSSGFAVHLGVLSGSSRGVTAPPSGRIALQTSMLMSSRTYADPVVWAFVTLDWR